MGSDNQKPSAKSKKALHRRTAEKIVVLCWVLMMPLAATATLFCILNPFLWPYLLWITFDKTPYKGGRRWEPLRRIGIWNLFRDYFPIRIEAEAELDPTKNYFFCAHPHGILPLSLFSNFATAATTTSKLFPNHLPHLCTLDSNFSTPILREIFLSLGMIPVSEESIRHVLSTRKDPSKGNYVIDVPGGSSESLDQQPGTFRLVLQKRKGIFRIALEEGVDMVPCIGFGDADVWKQAENPEGSALRKLQEWGKKIAGMSPTLFYGRGLSDSNYGIIPFRTSLTTVVGKPIPVKRVEKATDEQIDELREKYIQELKALFDRWKDQYAPDRKEDLRIVG